MPKKLYEVAIEHTLFVMAENEADAEEEALRNLREEEPETIIAREVRSPWPVNPHWRKSYPWGGDCDKTVGELLADMAAPSTPTEGK